MAQLMNQQRTVANLTRPVSEMDNNVSGGDGKETRMTFSYEFERCLIELADEVYGLSKPKEIAQKVLRKACEFYDADWCGIFDADMMLKLMRQQERKHRFPLTTLWQFLQTWWKMRSTALLIQKLPSL